MAGKGRPRPRNRRKAATLADVAKRVGVSVMAVSSVLNGVKTTTRLSDKKRAKVIAAARRLNYRPNAAARALADNRMNTLGVASVLVGESLNQYFLEVFNGVLRAAAAAQQNTTVFAYASWDQCLAKMGSICDGRIDGLILIAPTLGPEAHEHLPSHTPIVAIHANAPIPGVLNIESDEENASYQIVRTLIAGGHRAIMHVAGPLKFSGPRRRLSGWQRALRESDLVPRPLIETDFNREAARAAFSTWLATAPRPLPTAFVCASDDIALGVMDVLQAAGLRVPDDASVVGFDDTLIAQTSQPPLATVRQPLRELGRRAADELLQRIAAIREGRDLPATPPVVLANELVLRPSYRPR
ncbi:LacI family DNA-binding transcriptional regulator [Nibricoccus sp. IMCC34717]|uniref:LacI family DNA-binding transcriptional regulator n=1 Tax=Nibricoccus sp. IMCC34717 TaxID=3034021 RepID=UPI003851395B